jgi:diguanylate cyclase (GGDEF)-like protein
VGEYIDDAMTSHLHRVGNWGRLRHVAEPGNRQPMRLATITNWAYGATLVLTLVSGATMLFAANTQDRERAAVTQRYRLDQASTRLASEVTALNDEAADFVVTGDPAHLLVYQHDAGALQTVEARIDRVRALGVSEDALDALADAMHRAATLQDAQKRAIEARRTGDADEARRILFGPDYDRELDRVAADVERFQYRLDQRTAVEVATAANAARLWRTCSEIALGITGVVFLCVLSFVFKRRVLRPVLSLSDVVTRLAAQDYAVELPSYEIDEIGDMAQAIRLFRENGLERQRLEAERNADFAMRSLLSRMTQRMQECETMRHLERVIESFVPEILPRFAGRLYLLDEARGMLVETCSWFAPSGSKADFPPNACWALQRGELHRPRGGSVDVPCDHLDRHGEGGDSICLPLIAQRNTLGLLYLEPRADGSGPDAEVPEIYLRMLAETVGLAVGNLRLRDTLREMALADPLTGLSNRRHLDATLALQLAEADRLDQPVSCLMIDVDHFKRFNDVFGHEAGDAVLRAVGGVLRRSVREAGLAFRYGGEEFLLLLPAMTADQATRRAEQIRDRVRALRVDHDGRELGAITVSVGVASAPGHCLSARLVETADAALLRAKQAGRDRVVVAEARCVDGRMDVEAAGVGA